MSAPEVNIPLLRKAVEWAEAEAAKPVAERQWDQDWWMTSPQERAEELGLPESECGTAYCIAGWACYSNGEDFDPGGEGNLLVSGAHPSDRAQELLGLTSREANALFASRNTIEDVRCIAEEIAGERL